MAAKRKRLLFGTRPVYSAGKPNTSCGLSECEEEFSFRFPEEIRAFLLMLGAGSTEDFTIFHAEQIYPFDQDNGPIEHFVTFATDVLGNFYAFNPRSNSPSEIYYCSHDPLGYAKLAPDIASFLKTFVENEFNNLELTEKLELTGWR